MAKGLYLTQIEVNQMGAMLRREVKPTKKEGWASYDKAKQQVLKRNPFTVPVPMDEFKPLG